jgi:hypothetical protein
MTTQRPSATLTAKFLPFDKYHIARITDVTESAIDEAVRVARTELRDRELIGLNTARSHIVKALGITGGITGFKKEWPALEDFMAKHDLRKCEDLVAPRDDFARMVRLTHRQIADRFFRRGGPLPARLFTGYDVPWGDVNDRWFRGNPWKKEGSLLEGPRYIDVCEVLDHLAASAGEPRALLLEAAVAASDTWLKAGANNLLGDTLLDFNAASFEQFQHEAQLYFRPEVSEPDRAIQLEQVKDGTRLFRKWIGELKTGWVDVLRYNASLIFLRGPGGAYDFVFQGMRDEAFNHNPFAPHLRNEDVPKSNDTYHFKRWLYFEYEGHLESDQHQAESHFYRTGGTTRTYPGTENILKQLLTDAGTYHPPKKLARAQPGFITVNLRDRKLNVSNLVSIAELKAFSEANWDYFNYRAQLEKVDWLAEVNLDADDSLPASVTWYDANAYAAWISKTRGLPVRLLTEEEYLEITEWRATDSSEEGENPKQISLCKFVDPAGVPGVERSPRVNAEEDFQRRRMEFDPMALAWATSPTGLRFLTSLEFGEWLNEEAAAVNTLTRFSLCYPDISPTRGRFAAHSTGKYKRMKIGFRLCYLDEGQPAERVG